MKVSYSWLRELTGLDWSVEEMADRLTLCGTACEEIASMSLYLDRVVVGEVAALKPIEGADKIRLATVNVGAETLDLVCGAANVAVGQKVPVALEGAALNKGIVIKKTKIRGVESRGMICALDELGLYDDHSGIMVLPGDLKVGEPLKSALELDDYVMGFELTPNRGDSMSAIGIARDLAALAGVKVKYPSYQLKVSSERASDVIRVSIEDPDVCPRFTARIIRGVKAGPSPWWLQKKILGAGMRPISNIVDVTNLVMLETGNPVHAFDLDRFDSDQVVIRRGKQGEELTTLDGKKHKLTPDVIVISDGKRARAAGGVMGGFDSEIEDGTRNILLEVAYFDPRALRKSRKHLGFVTEASQRFEKGVDPNNVERASARVAHLLSELCGGQVLDGVVDAYPMKVEPRRIAFRPSRCNAVLGTDLPASRMVSVLVNLEFKVTGADPIQVESPTFRHDIEREVDLIEEIARIIGYDNIPDSTENIGPLFNPRHEWERFEDELRRICCAGGYDEIMGHGLAHSKEASLLNAGLSQVRIINPVSEDLDIMRNDLAVTALAAVGHNHAHRNMDLRLFEIGRAYFPPVNGNDWREEDRLSILVTGSTPATWREKPRALDLHDLTGLIEQLREHFRWPEFIIDSESKADKVTYLEEGQSFSVMCDGTFVGWIGKFDEAVAKRWDVKQPVFFAELMLEPLSKFAGRTIEFTPLPVFPAAPRDLALIIDRGVRVGEVVALVRKSAGVIAESVDVFDLYSGKQIGEGKKSVGISITYRSAERSLSSDEVDLAQRRVVGELERVLGAVVRDK